MIKYSYIKLTGCLVAAALAPLCTSAQRINTEASVERLKSESLQFSYSDNASGIQLDQMDYYSQVGLGYDIEKGSFKRAQEGEHNTGYRFFTDGGGTMRPSRALSSGVVSNIRATSCAMPSTTPR